MAKYGRMVWNSRYGLTAEAARRGGSVCNLTRLSVGLMCWNVGKWRLAPHAFAGCWRQWWYNQYWGKPAWLVSMAAEMSMLYLLNAGEKQSGEKYHREKWREIEKQRKRLWYSVKQSFVYFDDDWRSSKYHQNLVQRTLCDSLLDEALLSWRLSILLYYSVRLCSAETVGRSHSVLFWWQKSVSELGWLTAGWQTSILMSSLRWNAVLLHNTRSMALW